MRRAALAAMATVLGLAGCGGGEAPKEDVAVPIVNPKGEGETKGMTIENESEKGAVVKGRMEEAKKGTE